MNFGDIIIIPLAIKKKYPNFIHFKNVPTKT